MTDNNAKNAVNLHESTQFVLTKTIDFFIRDTGGNVVTGRIDGDEEDGCWTAVLSNEYAALKLYYMLKDSNSVSLNKEPDGWAVSVVPNS